MLSEVLEYLKPENGKVYLDVTFGAGGYTKAILESANCNVVAVDQDPNVAKYVQKVESDYGNRFKFIQANFDSIGEYLKNQTFDGIVADLGVSSMQLDEKERGFSFMKEGPLDMRMSCDGITAADFLNSATEEEIANVIFRYGEEHASRKIAKAIVNARKIASLTNTLELANLVRKTIGGKNDKKIDKSTKTFQAIRIYINKELEKLEFFLKNSKKLLNVGGKLAIVSFHSLEDVIVKSFFRENSQKKEAISKYSLVKRVIDSEKWLEIITKKPLFPSDDEIRRNLRSRSAKLRVAKRII